MAAELSTLARRRLGEVHGQPESKEREAPSHLDGREGRVVGLGNTHSRSTEQRSGDLHPL